MSMSLDPLKLTAQELHKFWFTVSTPKQWYSIMEACRREFGRNWSCQGKVLRKLTPGKFGYYKTTRTPVSVWFAIPDPAFATFIAVKLGIEVRSDSKAGPTINN